MTFALPTVISDISRLILPLGRDISSVNFHLAVIRGQGSHASVRFRYDDRLIVLREGEPGWRVQKDILQLCVRRSPSIEDAAEDAAEPAVTA